MDLSGEYLQSIFSVAQTDLEGQPFYNQGRTLRLVVEANVEAYALSLRFGNHYGQKPLPIGAASIALCDENGALRADTLAPVTVGGVLAFTLPAGGETLSDTIRFPLQPGEYFALSIYYPTDEKTVSGNWVVTRGARSRPGNYSADTTLPGPSLVRRLARTITLADMTVPNTSICEIIAHCPNPGRVVACFGDSITQQGNWTVPLQKRLHHAYKGQISLCNLGISGNRLLQGSPPGLGNLLGKAGIARFDEEVFGLHGVTHAILEIGTNDLGHPGNNGAPESDLITPAEYAEAMTALAQKLRARNIKAYVATIPPRALVGKFDAMREVRRQEMNHWIRGADCFDAVLDFDEMLRRSDGKHGMADGFTLPDGLHPSIEGGIHMAKSIPLGLFGGE